MSNSRLNIARAMMLLLALPGALPVLASDLAVTRLLEGPQPARRSQIISPQKRQQIDTSNARATAIYRQSNHGMVSVPAGDFLYGENQQARKTGRYRIDVTETSNADYRAFITAMQEQGKAAPYLPRYWQEYRSDYFLRSPPKKVAPFQADTFTGDATPVVGVDWWSANAYCQWKGKRLPSDLEWEKAARGTRGGIWPWGDKWDYANANTGGDKWGDVDGYIYAANVVSFGSGASPWGALNMAGNVAEWTAEGQVAGGSSNSTPSAAGTTARKQYEKTYRSFNIGFRCVKDE